MFAATIGAARCANNRVSMRRGVRETKRNERCIGCHAVDRHAFCSRGVAIEDVVRSV
jgi:hypothetical protein